MRTSPVPSPAVSRLAPVSEAAGEQLPVAPPVQRLRPAPAFDPVAAAGVPAYASAQGQFEKASNAEAAQLQRAYQTSLSRGLTQPPAGEVSRVTADDLTVDLNTADSQTVQSLLSEGTQRLPSLYYFTSGAGLWSRGGGQIKALVPLNLSELLSTEELAQLNHASDLVNAKSPADVLFIAGRDVPPEGSVASVAGEVVDDAKRQIDAIIGKARGDARALPPLAMKLVNVALASKRGQTYVPFDVWTSEQTHQEIAGYLQSFKGGFERMSFSSNPREQAEIVQALREYFAAAHEHGDTHLFGKQKGFHALDPQTGAPLPNTPAIGEGAGRAKAYLDESGRTGELLAQGKTEWVFENIEVFSDLPLLSGAHHRGGKDVSVVLVPQKDGYAGGSPFLITKPDGTVNLELHEQSALPPEYARDNAFFNANTLFQPLDAAPPQGLGFEVKNNGTQVRAKQNAGDITHDLSTAGIGGRVPVEYENLKTYGEFVQNGVPLIETYRSLWQRELAAVKDAGATAQQPPPTNLGWQVTG